jgi:hypothetical protein
MRGKRERPDREEGMLEVVADLAKTKCLQLGQIP